MSIAVPAAIKTKWNQKRPSWEHASQEGEIQINSSFLIHASVMIANDLPACKDWRPNDHPGQLSLKHKL